jgi:endoglucanase
MGPAHPIKAIAIRLLAIFALIGVVFGVFSIATRDSQTTLANPESLIIFEDSLSPQWVSWSWGADVSFSNVISFSPQAWGGMYLHTDEQLIPEEYSNFEFSLKRDTDSLLRVFFYKQDLAPVDNKVQMEEYVVGDSDGWKHYRIPISEFGMQDFKISGFAIQEAGGISSVSMLINNVRLTKNSGNTFESVFTNEGGMWENWSWGGTSTIDSSLNFSSNTPWAGLYLRRKEVLNSEDGQITFASSMLNEGDYRATLYGSDGQALKPFSDLGNFRTDQGADGWNTYVFNLRDFNNGREIGGIVIQDSSGTGGNTIRVRDITVNQTVSGNTDFVTVEDNNTQNSVVPSVVPSQSIVSASPAGSGYSASNNKIFKSGREIKLRGISWFGAETETYTFHGLWSRNWKEMITQIKSSGFNSVRVPFCPTTLKGVSTNSIEYSLNNDLIGKNSLQVMDTVLEEMDRQQLYILMDHHRPDCQEISPLWYISGYSENDWIEDLKFVAARYRNLEYFMGMDIKNEPHGNATWGVGNAATDWNIAAEKAGREVLSVNSNLLIFVQGVQENPTCSSNIGHWMGGNMEPLNCTPISSSSIPANKLVLSPHVYGPDVYPQGYFNDANYPRNLIEIWETHFGQFVQKGYTIVPGEWGGQYGYADPRDKAWQDAMVEYFMQKGICNSYYWSWNPNSTDTGGILLDDWRSVRNDKLQMLNNYFNSCR